MKEFLISSLIALCSQLQADVLYELKVGKYWKYSVSGKNKYDVKIILLSLKLLMGKDGFNSLNMAKNFGYKTQPKAN